MKRVLVCASFLVIVACGDDTYNYQFPEEDAPTPPVVQKPTPTPPPTEPTEPVEPVEPEPVCKSPRTCEDNRPGRPKCC